MKKLRVGILFGGRSGEHEVSLQSAASVVNAIDRKKYDVVLIGITKDGRWLTGACAERLLNGKAGAAEPEQQISQCASAAAAATFFSKGDAVIAPPVPSPDRPSLVPFETAATAALPAINVDVIFPVLHGTFGEDGTIQGLLELADIAYVGSGVLGSAAGMDKDIMKQLFRAAGLPIVKHVTVLRSDWESTPKRVVKNVETSLRYPVFVKPANLGSSVGISKVHDRSELGPALDEASKYDRKIVIEQGVGGKKRKAREIECAVLGNDDAQASTAGEVVPLKDFYDYGAKYLNEGSDLHIPAKLTKPQLKQVQKMAVAAFHAVDCSGLSRVDFLMDPVSGKLYLNEVNTMPGFTSISMYPKLWGATGIGYTELITRLIELGIERHEDKKRNQYTR
jgi:D-alanine-D-alanine ligase